MPLMLSPSELTRGRALERPQTQYPIRSAGMFGIPWTSI